MNINKYTYTAPSSAKQRRAAPISAKQRRAVPRRTAATRSTEPRNSKAAQAALPVSSINDQEASFSMLAPASGGVLDWKLAAQKNEINYPSGHYPSPR